MSIPVGRQLTDVDRQASVNAMGSGHSIPLPASLDYAALPAGASLGKSTSVSATLLT